MNITDVLREALRVLDDARVPSDLRASALPAVFNHLTAAKGPEAQANGKPAEVKETPDEGSDPLSQIAAKLSLDLETVRSVYHAGNTDLEIVAPTSRLPTRKALAMREITLLVVAGRQLGGYDEEYTQLDHARRACEDHKRLDGPNYAKSLANFEGLTFRGRGRAREARLSRPGRELAKALISRLGGGES